VRLKEYFSTTGSFSRAELAHVLSTLLTIAGIFAALRESFPDEISEEGYRLLFYLLYPVWGIALGKRSRDLGTTFTYGMIIGSIFPVMGVVFLFQEGKKSRQQQAEQAKLKSDPVAG
jgi:hypothetical protein